MGLRIHSVLFGWADVNQGEAKLAEGVAHMETALRAARGYGASTVLFVPCRIGGMPMPEPWEFDIRFDEKTGHLRQVVSGDNEKYQKYIDAHNQAVDASREGVRRLIPTAEKVGVVIAIENVWNNLWVKPGVFANFVASFDSPWLRAYFDIGNHVKYAPPQEWIHTLGKLIAKCHVKDFKLKPRRPRRRLGPDSRRERRLAGGAAGAGFGRIPRLGLDRSERPPAGRASEAIGPDHRRQVNFCDGTTKRRPPAIFEDYPPTVNPPTLNLPNLKELVMSEKNTSPSRRDFLKTTSTVAAGAVLSGLAMPRSVHAAGSDILRVGLIGCGGRGSGAAMNALGADPNCKIVAMADVFGDRLKASLDQLKLNKPQQVAVDPEHCFVGFDAADKLIASGVDVVLLAEPPHFRPQHLKAAVAAGKHVFFEKPVAVDAPGVRSVLASAEEAKKKGLNLVCGLCWRYDAGVRETMKRVLDGAIGKILTMQETYLTDTLWQRPRKPDWTEMVFQMRNWYYFTWLSGDFNTEQHVHSLDKASWAMGDTPPVRAWGLGGRQVRTDPRFGDVFDHHAVVYEYASGAMLDSFCRQMAGCYRDTSDVFVGDEGQGQHPPASHRGASPGATAVPRPTCTMSSTRSCLRRSAPARRSTTASTGPRARCWPSSAGWSITLGGR